MLSITTLYFVVTGIQFWISDYMRNMFQVETNQVFIAFAIISITGPTSGVILGGIILDKIGGYTAKGAMDFALSFGAASAIVGIPVPLLNSFTGVSVFIWLQLFFGGAIMPAIQGFLPSILSNYFRDYDQFNSKGS